MNFGLFPMLWRLWRAHGTVVFVRFCLYQLKGKLTGNWEYWLWFHVPTKGRMAIDAGASSGEWSLRLAKRFEEVIAFEPHPPSWRKLCRRRPHNLHVQNAALWSKAEQLQLVTYPDSRLNRITEHDFMYTIGSGDHSIPVRALPLDAFGLLNVDFIKVDVEGAEWHVLEGATQTIKRCRPVMIIEIHSLENKVRIMASLQELAYQVEVVHFPLYDASDPLYERRVWLVCSPA